MTPDSETLELARFRRHRHDVLNSLQLVKAYLQLDKPNKALDVVDELAHWLNAIAVVQAAGYGPELVWTVAEAPHLRFAHVAPAKNIDNSIKTEVVALIQATEAFAVEQALPRVVIDLREHAGDIQVTVNVRQEFIESWHNVHSQASWPHLQVHVEPDAQ